jgi:hypothetical protein
MSEGLAPSPHPPLSPTWVHHVNDDIGMMLEKPFEIFIQIQRVRIPENKVFFLRLWH